MVNTADNKGNSPIQKAAINGHSTVVTLLIQANADLNAKAGNGDTPLRRAIREGGRIAWGLEGRADFENYATIVESLLDHGADFVAVSTQRMWEKIGKSRVSGRSTAPKDNGVLASKLFFRERLQHSVRRRTSKILCGC
jgi:hypothetical protein